MALDTYASLQTAILAWLARPGDPLVSPTVPEFIELFEAEATRRLKHAGAEKRASLTAVSTVVFPPVLTASGAAVTTSSGNAVTTGEAPPGPQSLQAAALPADFGEMRLVTSGSMVLSYVAPMQLPGGGGLPRCYTIVGNAIYFGGTASGSVEIIYQAGVPPLTDAYPQNWLLTAHPDVYLFGSLVEAEAFIGHDERIALWAQRREAAFASIEQADCKARWGGGPLSIRAEGLQIMPSGTVWTPIPPPAPPVVQTLRVVTPLSGSTIEMTDTDRLLYVASGALAELTIRLPPAALVGDEVEISFAAPVTILNMQEATGNAVPGGPVNAYGPGAAIFFRYLPTGWAYWK